jgi:lipoprotein NlpI
MGHYDRAVEAFTSGLRHQPDYAWAYYRRGLSYEAMGEAARARADFEKAYALSPEDPEIRDKMRELGLR